MPNLTITLPEVDQSVSRPVIIGIIGQVQEICKIDKNVDIYFPGPMGTMQSSSSSIDSTPGSRDVAFESKRIIFIEVEDNYDPYSLGSTVVAAEEQIPVFEDTSLGVLIRPVYAKSEVKINFRYRTTSKNEAIRWMDDMRMRISLLRGTNLHRVQYHYAIPPEYMEILGNIYENRQKVAPYDDSFGSYVRRHMTERVTEISDVAGDSIRSVVTETQVRIQGDFDFEALPEKPERDDGSMAWVVSFSYNFSYEKPIGCNMKYPVMVHNNLLKKEYVDFTDQIIDPSLINKSFSKSFYAMNAFEMDTIMNAVVNPDPIMRTPKFDDFKPTSAPQGTGISLLVLSSVDETDKKTLINLNDLGDVMIDPDIMEFIKGGEWRYICKQFKSIISLTLYINGGQRSSGSIECDSDLNIYATKELNLRNVHHIGVGLCVDLTLLPRDAMERLKAYPKALVKIIGSMNELLRNNQHFNSLGDKNKITALEFSDLYWVMTGYSFSNGQQGRPSSFYNYPIDSPNLLDGVDPRIIENYRKNMITQKTMMSANIVAVKK